MKRVTRDVALSTVADLVANPRRATVAFTDGAAVEVLPARARCTADTHHFGVASDVADLDGSEVVLLVEAGANAWFELRGFSVRGVAARAEPVASEGMDLAWYRIEPRRILSWDYGSLREE